MDKNTLGRYYQEHHEKGKRYGYLYGGVRRGTIFKHWIGTGKKILDLGCRDGMLTEFYIKGNEVVGVDIDQKALELYSHRIGKAVYCHDINDPLPFSSSTFDVVVASELIEHIFYPDIFLKEVIRVLKPPGQFVGSTCNTFRLRNRWKFLIGQEYETDKTHLRRFCFRSVKNMLEEVFRDVPVVFSGGHIFGGGRYGIAIPDHVPIFIAELFALDILWNAKGVIKKS